MSQEPPSLLHIFSTFDPGGPQVRVAAIANTLGARFRHLIAAMDGRYGAMAQIGAELHAEVVRFPAPRNSLVGPLFFRTLIRKLHPDLVVTYNWGAIDAVVGARLAAVCPVIHTEDGFGPDEAVRLKLRRVLARRWVLNRIYKTVVPSQTLYRIASERYKLRPEKVELIPNGVDTRRFHPEARTGLRSLLGVPQDTVVFGYVGHLRREKNLSLLVHAYAAARLDNTKLALVGDGPCRGELEKLVHELVITDRVIFTGSTQEPKAYFSEIDVFVMASSTEQMPLALLEAMACGLPALCTDVGDIPLVLGAGEPPEIVSKNDAACYTNALRTLAQDSTLRAQIGGKNRKRAVDYYSLEQMVKRYEALYAGAMLRANESPAGPDEVGGRWKIT
jgi:glycosyltransferase involved in cell wall biosynthesis